MFKLEDIFGLAKVKIWDGGYSYDTQTKTCDIQDAYMQQSEEDVKPFYDGLDSTHRKILTQILSQVLHYDSFTKFLSLTVLADVKTKLFEDSLAWVDAQTKKMRDEEDKLKKEKDELREHLARADEVKEYLHSQLHDANCRH